jgi:sulfotransferase family protein
MKIEQPRLIGDPLVILAPGRCFSSVVCAMLGQHPQMFGLLETQLFTRDNMNDWWEDFGSNIHSHGILRCVAEIVFGEQSPRTINQAKRWLWTRRNSNTGDVFCELAEQTYPLIMVDKSPMVTYRAEHMQRTRALFPRAKFLHLVRHPVGYGRSLLKFFQRRAPLRHPNQTAALLRNPESIFFGLLDDNAYSQTLDPQMPWYIRQSSVLDFASTLLADQYLLARGEDLLEDPAAELSRILEWLGLRSDSEAIERMMHPEKSPFACVGPWNARFGGDPGFFQNPVLRPIRAEEESLENPMPWGKDGAGFKDEVKELARRFGYR